VNTFGFEAEFMGNVDAVIAALTNDGYARQSAMHSYHCRCEECSFDSNNTFRAQTDSSCGGEIISGVFHANDMETARAAMEALQEAAVSSDAEPGEQAGFHVHVGIERLDTNGRADALWAFLRWEEVLGGLCATGRFPVVRPFNHRMVDLLGCVRLKTILDGIGVWPTLLAREPWYSRYGDMPMSPSWCEEHLDADVLGQAKLTYLDAAYEVDRHGWLNVSTRGHATFEYRLFNSTRAAWRMEMYCRVALLMVNCDALPDLLDAPVTLESFVQVAEQHDTELASLLQRQMASPKDWSPLTVLGGEAVAVGEPRRETATVANPFAALVSPAPPLYLGNDCLDDGPVDEDW
jgi:hypothetical protein